jgi:endonuclease/exonuclease/phosphatase family metal-dependent hydrolase
MEILSYNIMSGGFSSYSSKAEKPERLEMLVKTLKEINADFVSLVDTHRWYEIFTPDDLKKIFEYEFVYSIKLDDQRLIDLGHDNGITVMTRLPVEKFETVRLFTRNVVKTRVEGIDIFSTYLDDLNEDTRIGQVKALLDLVDKDRKTIITGDLNTFDESDLFSAKAGLKILYTLNPGAKSMEPVTTGMARAEVTKILKEYGFVDMGKGNGNTIPSKLFPIRVNQPMLRVDYGFCTPDIKVQKFEVLRGEVFDKLSDHFPISMKIE